MEYFNEQKITIQIPQTAEMLYWQSFPSGHTTSAFSLFVVLALFFKSKIVAVGCFAMAVFVALSRIYLAAHFTKDVFAGMLIGVEISCVLFYFFEKKINSPQIVL